MERMLLYRSKADLDGSAYFEFQPGRYAGSHWVDGSVYVHEEAFRFVEPVVSRHYPGYDHYGFMTISAQIWRNIIADLRTLARTARGAADVAAIPRNGVTFVTDVLDRDFDADLAASRAELGRLVDDLADWLAHALEHHEQVSLLGM